MAVTFPARKHLLRAATTALATAGPTLAHVAPVRRALVGRAERWLYDRSHADQVSGKELPGVADDRTAIGLAITRTIARALAEDRFSPGALHSMSKILVQSLLIEQGEQSAQIRFKAGHKDASPPSFLTISPTKACNLRCTGCYADSGATSEKLEWATFDRIIGEAKTLWGARLIVLSGGEPFAYRSDGKGIVDMAEKHADCLFMAYTNGTLINDAVAERLARAGNLWPAISVEGWRGRTDERRGAGVFDKVLATMERLRGVKAPFGMSLTATRHNVEEILSQEFLDFFFNEQGVLFSWLFHYMPIGRSFTLDLMPTPEQRLWMWRRAWEVVRVDRRFLVDFWNYGTATDGCISAGGHGRGGYFYIDWNGAVSPCVFLPYAPVNVKEIYARGGNLNDVWADPFFAAVRGWQADFQARQCNEMAPCPMRDHHMELRRLLHDYEPDPMDENARAALLDPGYAGGLQKYDQEFQALADPVWERHYRRPLDPGDGHSLHPLPDIEGDGQTGLRRQGPSHM